MDVDERVSLSSSVSLPVYPSRRVSVYIDRSTLFHSHICQVARQVLEKKDRDVMEMMQKMKGIPGMGGLTMCCPAVRAPRLPLEYPLIPLKYPFQYPRRIP